MLRVRVASVDSEGEPTNFSYSVKKDGKEYPVTVTGVPKAGTTIWIRIDKDEIKIDFDIVTTDPQ